MVLTKNYYNTVRHVSDRYIYYRVYTEDGAVISRHPVDPDESYLARVNSSSVAPPHTVASLKACICKLEDINDPVSVNMFASRSSRSILDDNKQIAITSSPGPGYKAEDPIALVVKLRRLYASESFFDTSETLSDAKTAVITWVQSRKMTLNVAAKPKYIYYRTYKDSAMPAAAPFKRGDPTLGRININAIPPPHTVASLKRCICKAERIDNYKLVRLYESSNKSPIDDGKIMPILSGNLASTWKKHLSLVIVNEEQPSFLTTPNSERTPRETDDLQLAKLYNPSSGTWYPWGPSNRGSYSSASLSQISHMSNHFVVSQQQEGLRRE